MKKPTTYTIEKITDILQIPKERRAAFLAELPEYLEKTEEMSEALNELSKIVGGFNVEHLPGAMEWTDDGDPGLKSVTFIHDGEEVESLNFTKNAQKGEENKEGRS